MKKISKKNITPEYGFGTTAAGIGQRLMNADGSANVKRLGEPAFQAINTYHWLLTMSWRKFNFIVLCFYILFNILFACIYYVLPHGSLGGMIYDTPIEKFMEYFFFSAQTLSTVGYGRLNPVGIEMSTVAAIESMLGLLGFALATGLLYGRFSRPTAKLKFSDNLLIAPFKGDTAVMFRLANGRRNSLIEVEAQIIFSYNEMENGKLSRKFQTLKLDVERISYLTMSWTVVHPINEESAMTNLTAEDLKAVDAEFFIGIKGIDDTYAQQVHARASYKWNDVIWKARFVSVIGLNEQGINTVDVSNLNHYELI